MRTLFLNPPSFEGFDGGAGSRWPASREIESYWYPVWLAYPAGMLEGSRLLDAPRMSLYRCWTEPGLIKQWFAPKPYTTPIAELDLRPGGASNVVMKSPDGQEIPCPGQYLEIVPGQKLVFADLAPEMRLRQGTVLDETAETLLIWGNSSEAIDAAKEARAVFRELA